MRERANRREDADNRRRERRIPPQFDGRTARSFLSLSKVPDRNRTEKQPRNPVTERSKSPLSESLQVQISSEPVFDEQNSLKVLQPLEVVNDFGFSDSCNKFTPPFASKSEYYGFLSGSEGNVLCTQNEPVCSINFVQCAGALIRNNRTGLISLIHQSIWSIAAETILAVQRLDDLDVILIDSPTGTTKVRSVIYSHGEQARHCVHEFSEIDRTSPLYYSDLKTKDLKHIFTDNSSIRGVSATEMEEMFERCEGNGTLGSIRILGEIKLPGTGHEIGRLSLLYRPEEDVVWIYSQGKKQLINYPGFLT